MAPQKRADPGLVAPWQALYDDASGAYYYWNPQTNVTTYDRPAGSGPAPEPGRAAQPPQAAAPMREYTNGHSNGNGSSFDRNGSSAVANSASGLAYQQLHGLSVQGDNAPDPFETFDAAGFTPDMMEEIRKAGFSAPTPIQAQAWPIAMQGRDLVAIAKTGSGKTCGFLLPGMMHIKQRRNDPRHGPTVLVLAPTRELAVQIKSEADKFGRMSGIRNTCVYGGAPKGPQLRDLSYGVDIVIATPGRLNDFREAGQIRLQQVSYLVLDEADRMLDMGFEPQIQRIVGTLPPQRQTLFFSATWPREVKHIASQFVTNRTVHIFVGAVEEKLVANTSIKQHVDVLQRGDFFEKLGLLTNVLRSKPPGSRIIIFCTTKRTCDQLAQAIGREYRAAAIHGDKRQQERDWVLQSFKSGSQPIMVATDVAARGLDVNDVVAVVNFDFPTGVEDYIHRIGRTGRAGATGESYTFLAPEDGKYARELAKVMSEAGQVVPPALTDLAARSRAGGGKARYGGGGGFGGGRGGGFGGGRGGGFGGGGGYGGGGFGGGGYQMAAAAPYGGGGGSRGGRSRSRSPRRSHGRSRSRSPGYRGRSRGSPPSRRRSPSYGRYSPRR